MLNKIKKILKQIKVSTQIKGIKHRVCRFCFSITIQFIYNAGAVNNRKADCKCETTTTKISINKQNILLISQLKPNRIGTEKHTFKK